MEGEGLTGRGRKIGPLRERWKSILTWLYNYPDIYITYDPPNVTRASWTASWANEVGRKSMEHLVPILMGRTYQLPTMPRIAHAAQGTPKLKTGSFKALIARGLVKPVKMRPPGDGWSGLYYWQISALGEQALLEDSIVKGLISEETKLER